MCDAALAQVTAVLAPIDAAIAEIAGAVPDAATRWAEASEPLRACHEGRSGAWILMPSEASAEAARGVAVWGDEEEDSFRFVLEVTPTFVDAAGAQHPAPSSCSVDEQPLLAEAGRIALLGRVDYDGDGADEIIVRCEGRAMESSARRFALWSFRAGAASAYPPAEGIDVSGVLDADSDGRPDLISIERYWQATSCGDDPPPEGSPAVLFHALPDGSFSEHDDVAAAHLRAACPETPRRLLPEDDCNGFEASLRIACARLWGASAGSIRRRLTLERDRLPPDDPTVPEDVFATLLEVAAIDPPLSLRPAPDTATNAGLTPLGASSR